MQRLIGLTCASVLGAAALLAAGCSEGQRSIDDVRELVGLRDDDDRGDGGSIETKVPALSLEGAPALAPFTTVAWGDFLDPADPRAIELVWYDESQDEVGRSIPVTLTPVTFVAPVLIDPSTGGSRRGRVTARLRLGVQEVPLPGSVEILALAPSAGAPGEITLEVIGALEDLHRKRLLTVLVEPDPLLDRSTMVATTESRLGRLAALREAVVDAQGGGTPELGVVNGRAAVLDTAALRHIDDLLSGLLSAETRAVASPGVTGQVLGPLVAPALTAGEVESTVWEKLGAHDLAPTLLVAGSVLTVGGAVAVGGGVVAVGVGLVVVDLTVALVRRGPALQRQVGSLVASAFRALSTGLSAIDAGARAGTKQAIDAMARGTRSLVARATLLSGFLSQTAATYSPFKASAEEFEKLAERPLPRIETRPDVLVVTAGRAESFAIEVSGPLTASVTIPLEADPRIPGLVGSRPSVSFDPSGGTSQSNHVNVSVPLDTPLGTYEVVLGPVSSRDEELDGFDPHDVRVLVIEEPVVTARFFDVSYVLDGTTQEILTNFTISGDPDDSRSFTVGATSVSVTDGIERVSVLLSGDLAAADNMPCEIRVTGVRRLDPDTNPMNHPGIPPASAHVDIFEEPGRWRLFVTWSLYAYVPPGLAESQVIIPSSGGDAEIIVPR